MTSAYRSTTIEQALEAVSLPGLTVDVQGNVVFVRGSGLLRHRALERASAAARRHGWQAGSVVIALTGAGQ